MVQVTNPVIDTYGSEKRWVLWKYENVNGRPTKVCYQINGKPAKSNDPATWSTYAEVVKVLNASKRYAGIGIMLTDGKLLGCDGDHKLSGAVITDPAWAQFVESANSYSEITPSGEGMRVLLPLTESLELERKKNQELGFEFYTKERFFTFTGNPYGELKPLRTVTPDEACRLMGITGWPWRTQPEKHRAPFGAGPAAVLSDGDILQHMFYAKNGAKAHALYNGTPNGYGSPSEADSALCCHLAFWTQDHAQIKRLWMQSPLGERDKTQKREDYVDRTIANALDTVTEVYTPRSSNGHADPGAGPDLNREPEDMPGIDIDDFLRRANCSSQGNAECMALLYPDVRYDHTRLLWLIWNGEIWQPSTTGQVERLAVATARARYKAGVGIENPDERKKFAGFCISSENIHGVENTLKSARNLAQYATDVSMWDSSPWLANAGPVTLDLKTVQARENRKEDYITKRLGPRYDPNATCPLWEKAQSEFFSGDANRVAYNQRATGYTLTGDVSEQVFFLCNGMGANGKSVDFNIKGALLGDYAGATDFATFDDDTAEARGDLAKLRGTRLVTIIETDEDKRLAEARIKAVTGKDRVITARALYEHPFDYHVTFKIWISMNYLPVVRGRDKGIWRRIQRLDFTETFEGDKDDRQLENKLQAELPGILNWALEGLRQWHKQGLNPPKAVTDANARYQKDSDVVGQWKEECVETGTPWDKVAKTGDRMKSLDGYNSFRAWCIERGANSNKLMSHRSWSNRMKEHGYETGERETDGYWYDGIKLIKP